jgi:hypothetical protein
VTATATFLFAWWLLRGQRIGWKRAVAAVAAGFALVFAWALVDRVAGRGAAPTHIDSAVGAVAHGRVGYILGVALRKAGLALRIVFHPGTLLGLLGFVLLWVLAWKTARGLMVDYLGQDRAKTVLFGAGLRGALVAVLFNDSGAVAAILMLAALAVSLLHGIVREGKCVSLRSTSARSASA